MISALLLAALELSGVVRGPNGKPVAGARVQAGQLQATTDGQGRFQFQVEGPVNLHISAPGLEPQTLAAEPGRLVQVLLDPEVKGVVVEVSEGSSYDEGTSNAVMNKLEVYLTPGAAADVLQAVKALPGVAISNERAELYVRGGKADEVGLYLNGGRLSHPFHHPTPQGGLFSSVDTALVERMDFMPGAFSARYGDALSAVLELGTETEQNTRSGMLNLNLAQQGIQVSEPLAGGFSRASYRHADPTPLDRLWGLSASFTENPFSDDVLLTHQMAVGSGRATFAGLWSSDHLGVDLALANARNTFSNRSRTAFGSLSFRQPTGTAAALLITVSGTRHEEAWTFGHWGLSEPERNSFARIEWSVQASERFGLEAGLDGDHFRREPKGEVPFDSANWSPTAPARAFTYAFEGSRTGAYLTTRYRFTDRWGLSLGGRTDRYGLLGEQTRDLRATLSVQLSERVVLRLGGGTFHQAPPLAQLDPNMGNPTLPPQRATHALAALDARGSAWLLRLEAYRKDYDRLVVEHPTLRYEGSGKGFAEGIDLLLKGSRGAWRGWIGYGYLDTRRREGKQFVLGPVPTSVPHNLTLVGSWDPRPGWMLSLSHRQASGTPFTPILGGASDGLGNWRPLEGARYGDQLPGYGRTDLRLTHLFPWRKFRGVGYLEVMNLLAHRNLSGYSYSADYASRKPEESPFSRRILVAGLNLSW